MRITLTNKNKRFGTISGTVGEYLFYANVTETKLLTNYSGYIKDFILYKDVVEEKQTKRHTYCDIKDGSPELYVSRYGTIVDSVLSYLNNRASLHIVKGGL